jgi:hypothetical protein
MAPFHDLMMIGLIGMGFDIAVFVFKTFPDSRRTVLDSDDFDKVGRLK